MCLSLSSTCGWHGVWSMKKREVSKRFSAFVIGILLVTIGLVWTWILGNSYRWRLQPTINNLVLSRRSIELFTEQNGRFQDSLHELWEYWKNHPERREWPGPSGECISAKLNSTESSVLDGTGGLYYDPKIGELKINLTKPLKSYWRFYFGKKRNEIPADWWVCRMGNSIAHAEEKRILIGE